MKTIPPRQRYLDVGGTFIKCADGSQVPISSGGSREEIAAALKTAVGDTDGLEALGVAIPGPFDYQEGIFLMKHKFAAVFGESFRSLAGIPDTVTVRYHHDVNAVLLGAVNSLGLQDSNTALVTLGTGLGYSCALKGKVQYNAMGSPARHLWDLPLGDGILEDVVSGRGISQAYARKTGDASQSAYSVAMMAYAGKQAALEVYREVGETLGRALQPEVKLLDIDTLLVGGQIAKSLSVMKEALQEALPDLWILSVPDGAVFEGLASLFR